MKTEAYINSILVTDGVIRMNVADATLAIKAAHPAAFKMLVHWGDGQQDIIDAEEVSGEFIAIAPAPDSEVPHSYAVPGTYAISVDLLFPQRVQLKNFRHVIVSYLEAPKVGVVLSPEKRSFYVGEYFLIKPCVYAGENIDFNLTVCDNSWEPPEGEEREPHIIHEEEIIWEQEGGYAVMAINEAGTYHIYITGTSPYGTDTQEFILETGTGSDPFPKKLENIDPVDPGIIVEEIPYIGKEFTDTDKAIVSVEVYGQVEPWTYEKFKSFRAAQWRKIWNELK